MSHINTHPTDHSLDHNHNNNSAHFMSNNMSQFNFDFKKMSQCTSHLKWNTNQEYIRSKFILKLMSTILIKITNCTKQKFQYNCTTDLNLLYIIENHLLYIRLTFIDWCRQKLRSRIHFQDYNLDHNFIYKFYRLQKNSMSFRANLSLDNPIYFIH